jgi:hypothetical protein
VRFRESITFSAVAVALVVHVGPYTENAPPLVG